MIVSVLKFFAKTVSVIFKVCLDTKSTQNFKNLENEAQLRLFVRRLLNISMMYALSLEGPSSGSGDGSFVHRAQSQEKFRLDSKFSRNLDFVCSQPQELRHSIRAHIQKVFKSVADENLIFLLSIIRVNIDESDLSLLVLTHVHMLDVLRFLIKCRPAQMNMCLDLVVKLILKSIETTHSEIRKKCTDYAKATLKSLLSYYPNSAFNMQTQHFIVPNAKNELVVFDLKMALECVVLARHTRPINAIAIHPDGNHLVSFSLEEGRLIVWEIEYQGFFNSFFKKSDNKVMKEVDINKHLQSFRHLFVETTGEWSLKYTDLKEVQLFEKTKNLKFVIRL